MHISAFAHVPFTTRFRAFVAFIVVGFSISVLSGVFASTVFAQQGKPPASPPATATTTFDGITVTVNYSQPSKKGREIFGKLVPYGEVWRTGANATTTITLSGDVMIAGKSLKAGAYTLFTIPTKDTWTIIINSEDKQWGAYTYKKDKDVLRVEVPALVNNEVVEAFTIAFGKADKGATMTLAWDMTKVSVPFTK